MERIFGTNTRDSQPLVHFHVPRFILKRSLFSTLKNCVRENNSKGVSERALFFAACILHPQYLASSQHAVRTRCILLDPSMRCFSGFREGAESAASLSKKYFSAKKYFFDRTRSVVFVPCQSFHRVDETKKLYERRSDGDNKVAG